MTYLDRAQRYIDGVLSGEIPACKFVRQAVERQARDLANPPSGYQFDAEKAARVCQFVELCPHIKGELANRGELIRLEDWQVFILTTVFGWVDQRGNRRFRKAYIEVPRGNGKSSFSSPIGLYMLALDGEAGSEVYSAATTRDQARIVFRDAQAMARKMGGFRKRFGVDVTANAITQLKTSSTFKALSADGHTLDGLNIHLAIVDELHAHKTRDVYDVLEGGMGKRPQSLLWMITTAGSNKEGICYLTRKYVSGILSGTITDSATEATFGIIYTIDEGDDPFAAETLAKANPNWGVSVDVNSVMQRASKAKHVALDRPEFFTKNLNVWVDAESALFDYEQWLACEDKTLNEADFYADEAVIGVDVGLVRDFTAVVRLYRRKVNGADHFYAFPKLYLPERCVSDEEHENYRGWEMRGDMVTHPGETVKLPMVQDDIREFARVMPGLRAMTFDFHQGAQLVQTLQAEGYTIEKTQMSTLGMSEPTKTLDALMRERRIHHPGNGVLNWMIGNVVGHFDAKDNVYPKKDTAGDKIDGAIALIMALGWFLTKDEAEAAATPWDLDPEFKLVM